MGEFSIWHWLIVIVIVLLLFGRGKISGVMGDVAEGIKAFKKGIAEDDKPAPAPSDEVNKIDHPDQDRAPTGEAASHAGSANT